MFSRITSNQAILNGKPCIKGTRISIEFILELLSSGATFNDILKNYPHLTEEDLQEALQYASRFLKNEIVIMAEVKN
ncbi:MAG: DUF433 domain-containing protein [Candidatus Eremiobacterota bacterium]